MRALRRFWYKPEIDSPSLINPYIPTNPVKVMLMKWEINAIPNPADEEYPNKEKAPTIAISYTPNPAGADGIAIPSDITPRINPTIHNSKFTPKLFVRKINSIAPNNQLSIIRKKLNKN